MRISTRFFCAMVLTTAIGSAADGPPPITCLSELTFPRFLPTWMGFAPASGTIFLTLDQMGDVSSVQFDSKSLHLNMELEHTFRYHAHYSRACGGSTISFTVRYVILNEERQTEPVAIVKYEAPNRFTVSFPPMKPIGERQRKGQGDFH